MRIAIFTHFLRGLASLTLLGISLGVCSGQAQTPFPLQFELPTQESTVKLGQYAGKLVYVDFWTSWCGPCRHSFPFMNELHQKYYDAGLRIIAVNVDQKKSDAEDFLSKHPAHFLIAYDSEAKLAKQYQVKGMPSSYLIGRDGQLIHIHRGFKTADKTSIESLIQQALK